MTEKNFIIDLTDIYVTHSTKAWFFPSPDISDTYKKATEIYADEVQKLKQSTLKNSKPRKESYIDHTDTVKIGDQTYQSGFIFLALCEEEKTGYYSSEFIKELNFIAIKDVPEELSKAFPHKQYFFELQVGKELNFTKFEKMLNKEFNRLDHYSQFCNLGYFTGDCPDFIESRAEYKDQSITCQSVWGPASFLKKHGYTKETIKLLKPKK